MGTVRKIKSNRGDIIKINSDAPKLEAKITVPRRRPIMFNIDSDKDVLVKTG